jgi:pimeloyl-ACP methyl ester carboxylesterase
MKSRHIRCNSIDMHVVEAGAPGNPLVVLAHGWPESWYSWRHQLPALAAAGFHVLAPDMRGYGGTDAPPAIEDYDILHLVDDMVALVEAVGAGRAAIVGHDWGAIVAWHAALLRPDRFPAVAALSVPHLGRPDDSPLRIWKKRHGDDFYYILYHQRPGVAEAEYEADPEGLLRMLYASPDSPREAPTVADPHRGAGGFIGRWGRPLDLPDWLSKEDLAFYVNEFRRAGFRGGVNWYRNFERNWELMEGVNQVVRVPALMIAGSRDLVVAHLGEENLRRRMKPVVPELKALVWIEGAGHWIQQERPAECNRALLAFLRSHYLTHAGNPYPGFE